MKRIIATNSEEESFGYLTALSMVQSLCEATDKFPGEQRPYLKITLDSVAEFLREEYRHLYGKECPVVHVKFEEPPR